MRAVQFYCITREKNSIFFYNDLNTTSSAIDGDDLRDDEKDSTLSLSQTKCIKETIAFSG